MPQLNKLCVMLLREVLHAHIPWLTPHSTLQDAIDKMNLYQFSGLVLVDEEQKPIGVLTEGDIARAVSIKGSLTQIASDRAHTYATQNPTTAPADCEVSDSLHLMLMRGLSLLPVTEENKLIGVVFRVDLMQAILIDCAEETSSGK